MDEGNTGAKPLSTESSALSLGGKSSDCFFLKLPKLSFLTGHISSRNIWRNPQGNEYLVLSSMPGTEKELHKRHLIPSREKRKLAQEGGQGGWYCVMAASN